MSCLVLGHDVEFFSDAGFDLDRLHIRRNSSVAQLYEDAVKSEGAVIGADGALIVSLLLDHLSLDQHKSYCFRTSLELKRAAVQKISGSYLKKLPKMTYGGGLSTSRWMSVSPCNPCHQ